MLVLSGDSLSLGSSPKLWGRTRVVGGLFHSFWLDESNKVREAFFHFGTLVAGSCFLLPWFVYHY